MFTIGIEGPRVRITEHLSSHGLNSHSQTRDEHCYHCSLARDGHCYNCSLARDGHCYHCSLARDGNC